MYLYNLTLSRASGIQCAVYGNFSAPKAQEIVVSRGKTLELLRPDDTGKVQTIFSTELFGCIRSLAPFRLTGASRDYIIVGSDSGRIVILEYMKDQNYFKKIHQETYGKSGCRRIVPGQYLAIDPKGRACLIGAMEKQKLVYVLNRDQAANLTISSPLEAHKSHNIVFSVIGLDMGFDNPVFAAIELDYADADQDPTGEAAGNAQKQLTLYELDLGLNHVTRKWSQEVDNGANLLVPVPGGADGPGGVLVCAENFIIYSNQDHEDVRAVIPRRTSLLIDRGVLIVSYATHKQKSLFFFLVQSEYGDLYKVTLAYQDNTVTELKIKYFDTIPPCTSICVLKTGFLFAAAEFGNHALYQFLSIGDDDDAVEASSSELTETQEGFQPVFFDPRPLRNLRLVDEVDSMSPIMDFKVANLLKEEIPQLYVMCGRGARSTLRVLRPGLAATEIAVSPLPGNPTAVWTLKRSTNDSFDAYIIVSFTNATLVLSIGETVVEVNDSGFLGTVPTLRTQLLTDDSMLQIHPSGLRHIRADRRVNEWRAPGRRTIVKAATNEQQVVIALSGGELIYFELSPTGQLMEVEKKELAGDVVCLDIAPVPEGRQRSRFLAVASYDSSVRILSLDPEDMMSALAVQMVSAVPESLLFIDSPAADIAGKGEDASGAGGLFLNIGLLNGVLLRTEVDKVTGQLSDTRTRFLGTRPPKLFAVSVRGKRSMLALSSRPWLGYSDMGRYTLAPLSYEALDYASGFASDQCPEGFCAVSKSMLRILTLERLGEAFNQQVTRLRYTPRKFVVHPESNMLIVAEADHAAVPLAERRATEDGMETDNALTDGIEFDEERAAEEEQHGAPKNSAGRWASCVRVLDPTSLQTSSVLELDGNEAAVSLCLVRFTSWPEEGLVLAVGTVQGLAFYPRTADEGYIRLYRFKDNGRQLELIHKTPTGGIPGALAAFKGRLLAGVGATLRIYEAGKKKLLRKCEHRKLPTHIATLATSGDRIFVGDLQESMHYFRYKANENALYEYADDIAPRHLTAALPLDYDTVAGADKFCNIFVTRLPRDVSNQVEEDPTGGKFAGVAGLLNGAPHKLEDVVNFHVGDLVTSLQRAVLQPGGREVLLYATVMGAIGAMLPFPSREDVDFFSHLEMHLRQEHPPMGGRDHMSYRSSYFPVKDVIDGDLCEQYSQLPAAKQKSIADELERTPGEILKKLEDIRNQVY
ncbi:hypothetical protein WJX75_006568 [Coccomyxa subellipsoidea]|uniref:Splicing factor 3B subunit 3 n=1 Tax=Coccomyxa subellipsoidea TaxID=248742 RepID=A0ABR2YYM4_9CHLO